MYGDFLLLKIEINLSSDESSAVPPLLLPPHLTCPRGLSPPLSLFPSRQLRYYLSDFSFTSPFISVHLAGTRHFGKGCSRNDCQWEGSDGDVLDCTGLPDSMIKVVQLSLCDIVTLAVSPLFCKNMHSKEMTLHMQHIGLLVSLLSVRKQAVYSSGWIAQCLDVSLKGKPKTQDGILIPQTQNTVIVQNSFLMS